MATAPAASRLPSTCARKRTVKVDGGGGARSVGGRGRQLSAGSLAVTSESTRAGLARPRPPARRAAS
eukprot:15474369-Alexandrium_andersonii.AAC.1